MIHHYCTFDLRMYEVGATEILALYNDIREVTLFPAPFIIIQDRRQLSTRSAPLYIVIISLFWFSTFISSSIILSSFCLLVLILIVAFLRRV